MVNPQPQLRRKVVPGYQLNEDIDKGYKEAVQGNQTNMALRYLELIMERQQTQITELKAEIESLKAATGSNSSLKATPKPKPEKTEESTS